MAYKKHPSKSRRYRRSTSHSDQPTHEEQSVQSVATAAPVEQQPEKRNSNPLGFLSSLLGTRDRSERSGNPVFNVLNYDVYFDDLLLVGLIFLIMTEKDKDELLLIVLAYLLLDIF